MNPILQNFVVGFYPAILRVEHPVAKFKETMSGNIETDAEPSKIRFFDRIKGELAIFYE